MISFSIFYPDIKGCNFNHVLPFRAINITSFDCDFNRTNSCDRANLNRAIKFFPVLKISSFIPLSSINKVNLITTINSNHRTSDLKTALTRPAGSDIKINLQTYGFRTRHQRVGLPPGRISALRLTVKRSSKPFHSRNVHPIQPLYQRGGVYDQQDFETNSPIYPAGSCRGPDLRRSTGCSRNRRLPSSASSGP